MCFSGGKTGRGSTVGEEAGKQILANNRSHLVPMRKQTMGTQLLLTLWVYYWQSCQPVARLLKQLIIDELTCKSIMQTGRQPRRLVANKHMNKQWQRRTKRAHVWGLILPLWAPSFMSLRSAEARLWFIATVTSVLYGRLCLCRPGMKSSIAHYGHYN